MYACFASKSSALILSALLTTGRNVPNIINAYRDILECGCPPPPHPPHTCAVACLTAKLFTACSNPVRAFRACGAVLRRYTFLKTGILRPPKTKLVILNHVTSVLRPGRCTLLLGPPGSGGRHILAAHYEGCTVSWHEPGLR